MKFIHILCLLTALFVGSIALTAQTTTGSNGFFLHTVTKGQSLYSISRMYNVSVDDIVRLNPGSNEKIRTGETLKIPQATDTNKHAPQYHTIQAGETLYQLTVKYGITAQAICAANPGLSASNFRIGQVIVIPAQTSEAAQDTKTTVTAPSTEKKKEDWKTMHKVQRRETIFSISREYGITEEELIAANPELKKGKLKRGTFLFIPYPKSEQAPTQPERPVSEPTNEELFNQNTVEKKSINTIKVALVLPFSHTNGSQREPQSRIVEFYEGFLIAADSLKRTLKDMDLIIGPVNQSSIAPIAEFAQKHNIRLVVPFAPKVDQVFNSPLLYQVNTPQSYLYSEVYEHFIRKFGKSNVVFLDDGTPDPEKADFIKGMKSELKDNGIRFSQIRLGAEIDPNKIISAMDTLQQNVFIPISARSTALTKLVPHLTLVRKEHPHFNMHLFGYPEWQTYTQDFGMLGFDIGYFFLKGLSQQGNKLEDNLDRVKVVPIQTGFKFERVNNWGGFINRKIFFVHFSQDYELIKLDFE